MRSMQPSGWRLERLKLIIHGHCLTKRSYSNQQVELWVWVVGSGLEDLKMG